MFKTEIAAAKNSWNHVDKNDRGIHLTWLTPTTPLLFLVSPEAVGPVFKNSNEVINKSSLLDTVNTGAKFERETVSND